MKIISLGWGVQSFTLAAMVALGELEPIDAAIHADTTHESKLTYEFADRWRGWLEERGVRVVTVVNKISNAIDNGWGWPSAPFFTINPDRSKGQIQRQCTFEWKIANIRRWEQSNRKKEPVEQWIGISWDESLRMRESGVKYITHRWPLIEKHMTRHNCENWLRAHDLEVPEKSACTFCPFHSTAEWRRIKRTPEDWAEAVAVDEAVRNVKPPNSMFVHPSRKPLELVDLRTEVEKGQISLWDKGNSWDNECSGICGV
jgi:hypothetical protein